MPTVNLNVTVDTNVDYTPDQLREFLSRLLVAGKDFTLNDEQAESDLADMMTEIIVGDAELAPDGAWVTHFSHRHGDDLYLSASEDEARRQKLAYCLNWWDDAIAAGEDLPRRDDFQSFGEWADAACSAYFRGVGDEFVSTSRVPFDTEIASEDDLLARAREFWGDDDPAEDVNATPKLGM
jgi:hypothetical protein